LTAFARRWRIAELALFGSVLTADFGPHSDVDMLVSFEPGAEWSLLDHVQMQEQLSQFLGRPVDLVTRRAVVNSANPIRRRAILEGARVIYARS
jgi:hypothetical protein